MIKARKHVQAPPPKELQPERTLVTAFAEAASGPGWANRPIWIIYRDREGQLHEECIQPDDQTIGMHLLYGVSQAIHGSLCNEIIRSRREYTR